jgi:hypothetical protein
MMMEDTTYQSAERIVQRDQALARANKVRRARAEIKRQLGCGDVTLADLLADPPEPIANARIGDVLVWARGIGSYRASRILAGGPGSPGVGAAVQIAHLSDATIARILVRFEEWVPFKYAPEQTSADYAACG